LQAGPQAQDVPSLLVATLDAVEFEFILLGVEFIACSVGVVIGRGALYPPRAADN